MTRTGVRFFIEQDPEIKVIGEAKNGKEGIALCDSLNPDVVLMDVSMPVLNGIEAAKVIIPKHPNIKIVMLTAFDREQEIRDSLTAGANGYCLKNINDSRLIAAIKGVMAGDIWLDSSILGALLESSLNQENSKQESSQIADFGLSDREKQVIAKIVEGKTNQKIAAELYLSVDTVKSHLKAIMDKLSVSDRTQAAVKAVREGLA